MGDYGFYALPTQKALMSLVLLKPWLLSAGSAHGDGPAAEFSLIQALAMCFEGIASEIRG